VPVLVFSLVAHEYAHAATALRQGDDTAYALGRVTLNPLPHIDLWLTILLPALLLWQTSGRFVFGGAKPVPITPSRFRNLRRGDIVVSSAGVLTNLMLSVVCAVLFVLLSYLAPIFPDALGVLDAAQRMMMWGIRLNLVLCFFNLIPIPPLDGSKLFYYLLPEGLGRRYRSLDRFGFLPLLALMLFFPAALNVLLVPVGWSFAALQRLVVPFAVGSGWDIFRT
jgi:Zn-dependent protease